MRSTTSIDIVNGCGQVLVRYFASKSYWNKIEFREVKNNHTTSVLKHVSIELRQKVNYTSGEAKRTEKRNNFSARLITRLVCGSVAPGDSLSLHHSIQIPHDCYPSLERNNISIQSRPVYIPIHMLKTPYRPFMPVYTMPPMFSPPQYKEEPRFLKIEEITD
ncbi:hypothetical protein OESDEN_20367 [Oesophagostomum dentatum]|uniref:Arrestin domain protein n=1 Tax=Oesophagostomum dentatum TaxID=61180 RepID=A0A0B1S4W2_OESDE|nr:hypothetical protein OESDEN_20367 [Oesophagostomum dentatum]